MHSENNLKAQIRRKIKFYYYFLYLNRSKPKFVRLGVSALDNSKTIDVNIVEIIAHPQYVSKNKNFYNDIALLRLERKITFQPNIRPACLADAFEWGSDRATAVGYENEVMKTVTDGAFSELLTKEVHSIYEHAECDDKYASEVGRKLPLGIIEESQFCAGSRDHDNRICWVSLE